MGGKENDDESRRAIVKDSFWPGSSFREYDASIRGLVEKVMGEDHSGDVVCFTWYSNEQTFTAKIMNKSNQSESYPISVKAGVSVVKVLEDAATSFEGYTVVGDVVFQEAIIKSGLPIQWTNESALKVELSSGLLAIQFPPQE